MSGSDKQGCYTPVIDFHTHILPRMDDGSKSSEMSLEMLFQLKQEGVGLAIATPHFYGHKMSVPDFLERRNNSWSHLSRSLDEDFLPKILLGAEVAMYSRLPQTDGLERLCISGTDIMLLEMPFASWTGYDLDVVSHLCINKGYRIILAHLDRFLPLQHDRELLDDLLSLPLWVQINADSLCSFRQRKASLSLFRNGQAHLLGSDCHNPDKRPPNLGQAREILRKKLGTEVLEEIDACGWDLLNT